MSSYTFRKTDAPSVLVLEKTWDDILDKPSDFYELAKRIINMANEAELNSLATKTTTLRAFRELVNAVLLRYLQENLHIPMINNSSANHGPILADAFWDEIKMPEAGWERMQEAFVKANNMRLKIQEHQALDTTDTFQETKDNFNDTIMKPLKGINEDD